MAQPDRYEALTGRSLRECSLCHTGIMVLIDCIARPRVCVYLQVRHGAPSRTMPVEAVATNVTPVGRRLTAPTATDEASNAAPERERRDGPWPPTAGFAPGSDSEPKVCRRSTHCTAMPGCGWTA